MAYAVALLGKGKLAVCSYVCIFLDSSALTWLRFQLAYLGYQASESLSLWPLDLITFTSVI